MDKDKLITALARYARDNANIGGKVVEVTLKEDFNDYVQWSTSTWEDGVPVTKCFHRNPEIPLFVPSGTKLMGITYTGMVSHTLIFDFYYGSTWYSFVGAELLFDEE
jgi:hypothetical protein